MYVTNLEKGYVALISILVVSSLLLTTTLSLAQFAIAQRFFILDSENKKMSYEHATACVEIAQIYSFTHQVLMIDLPIKFPVGDSECSILSLSQTSSKTTVTTQAIQGKAITTLKVILDNQSGKTIVFEEL